MFIQDFINKWFWLPTVTEEGYNIIDTTVYAIIFIFAVFLLYKYYLRKKLDKNEIKFNRYFVLALVGWIIAGSSLRVLRDLDVYKTFWFVTPGMFFVIATASILTLHISVYLQKKLRVPYYKSWAIVGYLIALYNVTRLPLHNSTAFYLILGITALCFIFLFTLKALIPRFLNRWNFGVLQSHLFDATATFVGIQFFGFREIHVLPTFLIGNLGPWIMFPLKLLVVSLVLYYIDKYAENDDEKKYLKIIIIILGLATGTRDVLLLLST